MRIWVGVFCLLALPALATPAALADERAPFFGTWGTPAQCAGLPILPGGSKRASAFVISAEWMRYGETWCALRWFPVQRGQFASTRAVCGEDSQISYRLDMVRDGDDLTLVWDEALANGPLTRCPGF